MDSLAAEHKDIIKLQDKAKSEFKKHLRLFAKLNGHTEKEVLAEVFNYKESGV